MFATLVSSRARRRRSPSRSKIWRACSAYIHGFGVTAEVDQILQGAVEGAAGFQVVAQALVDAERLPVEIQRSLVLPLAIAYMAQRTQAGRPRGIVAQSLGHHRGGVGHAFGLPYVHMQQTHYLVVERA